ncbi:HAMP domain-containing sensor histidine kinase [Rummeliibacillus suwonensis]|uniref:HAMP domain-containing sensor histidine kinase n=1 Tax=Rummeliibacillus suwonensis TaxID=1306154 RepID=UPI001AAF1D5D|nr:HAMP domain-containing histidine kinase [Rummeliibacillus suwonensis]MBO2537020.1 HAMP domain-containing protein [Rummeliibacillus suwonensis]
MKNLITISFRNQSLKTKWALTSAFVIFISFAIICSVLYWSLHMWLLSEQRQTVNRTMDDLTVFFESQGNTITLDDIQANKGLMNSIIDKDQTVRILNKDGIEILRINDTVSEIPDIPNKIFAKGYVVNKQKIAGIESFVATGKIQIGLFQGYIQLTHPLTSFHSLMNYLLMAMLILGIGALVLSAYIGYVLATVLLRSLHDLRQEMTTVAEKGFEAPIQMEYNQDDEIGDLLRVYRKMMGELEQSFLLQQQFISDASHELRTPIQVVEGHLSLIQRWGKDDPEILNESLGTALSEIKRMKNLIEEMLELARGQSNEHDGVCDIWAVTNEIIQEQTILHPDVTIHINDQNLTKSSVAISQNAFGQIMRNLLQNAIRYSDDQTTIQIYLTNDLKHCKIEVEDNGIGIAENDLPHIFERFYRVDEARSRDEGGTGLGLSIVKMLVNKYGGNITVTSKLGKGTKFKVILPFEKL